MADTRSAPGTLTMTCDRIPRVAARQEGIFHQTHLGVSSATTVLAYLARQGEVVPVSAGVYRHAAHPEHRDEWVRASWIATDGTLNRDRWDDSRPRRAVVGRSSAARRFGLDLGIDPLLWVSANAAWPPDASDWMLGDVDVDADVVIGRGDYPYTSLERTSNDALLLGATPSSLQRTLRETRRTGRPLDRHRLNELLDHSAAGRRLAALLPDQSSGRRHP